MKAARPPSQPKKTMEKVALCFPERFRSLASKGDRPLPSGDRSCYTPPMSEAENNHPESEKNIPEPKCAKCRTIPTLVQTVLDPSKGRSVRLFSCSCGERVWDD
ncbi:hypothetical protein GGD62_001586 [Bradyrhizobium sp. ERR14]|nr:hypothetical protein [Bradyrhizobium sp. ERR14]